MTKAKFLIALIVAAMALPGIAEASDREREIFASSRPRYESQGERNIREGLAIAERRAAAERKEALRDKTHDNRWRVGPNTSVGVGEKGVNIIRSYR